MTTSNRKSEYKQVRAFVRDMLAARKARVKIDQMNAGRQSFRNITNYLQGEYRKYIVVMGPMFKSPMNIELHKMTKWSPWNAGHICAICHII